jgi:hypothetical protein
LFLIPLAVAKQRRKQRYNSSGISGKIVAHFSGRNATHAQVELAAKTLFPVFEKCTHADFPMP